MDLLDDFDRVRATFAELGQVGERIDSSLGDAAPVLPGSPISAGYDAPGLSVEVTVRQAARGRGQVVAAACASDSVVLATSRGYLLRYSWDDYGNEKVTEHELTRASDARVRGLWLDPSATHVLACVKTGSHCELHYHHASWAKPRQLSKLRGLAVSAVGWQKQAAAAADGEAADGRPGSAGGRSDDADAGSLLVTTGDVIIGSEAGSLHVTSQDSRSKREGGSSLLLDFKDKHKAICSIEQELLPGGRRVVLLATPSALHVAVGGPGLTGLFAQFSSGVSWEPLLEVAAPSLHSRLVLIRPGNDASCLPDRFAWLVGGRLLHGHLLLPELAGDASVTDAAEFVGDMRQLLLPPSGAASSPEDEPHALACSEYHYLLLYADKLAAINQVSGRRVAEVAWGPGSHASSIVGTPLGLMADGSSGTMHLWSSEALHDVSMSSEGKDMWRIYLEHQDYSNALRLAVGAAQRDTVHQAMGDDAAAAGDFRAAGGYYARIVGAKPPFEELALALVESGDPEALTTFLATKLQVLGPNDKAQATMVASWLTELLLDQINRDLLAGAGQQTPAYTQHVEQLRSFLVQHAPSLNWATTTALLESYGRLEELEAFAAAKGDQEALLEYLMRAPGDGAKRALGVLRKPSVGPQLIYKFAPELLAAAPVETVDLLVQAGASLDPRCLLPALVRFGEPGTPPERREQVLRYVRYALEVLSCQDSAVANLAVALLSLEEGEARLLDFLASARDSLGRPLFDVKYALRLAKERGRRRACVKLLCELGLHEDAVALALAVDLELAKAVASGPEDDEALRRKLWLRIAKAVVQGGEGGAAAPGTPAAAADGSDQAERIKLAVEFLRDAGGLLKIEDVLPFFPDFVTIDNFKGAITDSLARYNRQIAELKGEMDEATDIAEAVRRDLAALSSRAAVVSSRQPCAACGRAILEAPPNPLGLPSGGGVPPFYLYPTSHAFHVLCAASEVVRYGGTARAARVRKLLGKLSRCEPTHGGGARGGGADAELPKGGSRAAGGRGGAAGGRGGGGGESVAVLSARLEEEVGCEDPWNGELLVRLLDLPFVEADADAAEVDSWRI